MDYKKRFIIQKDGKELFILFSEEVARAVADLEDAEILMILN